MAILALMFLLASLPRHTYSHAPGVQCVNNLKQCGLATRVWEGDNNDKYPPQVSVTNGGSMELTTGPNAWRTFQVMSNELSTPKVVICPEDSIRFAATNFTFFNNSNVSFFFGVDAKRNQSRLLSSLAIAISPTTCSLKNAVMELTTNQSPRWTKTLHETYGNIGLSDGSVQRAYATNLQSLLVNSGLATNRLQMPILGP